jgi:hypothetical protein
MNMIAIIFSMMYIIAMLVATSMALPNCTNVVLVGSVYADWDARALEPQGEVEGGLTEVDEWQSCPGPGERGAAFCDQCITNCPLPQITYCSRYPPLGRCS